MLKISAIIAVLLVQTACSSTVLTKVDESMTERSSTDRKVEQTHHIALFGLWEVSPPFSPKNACGVSDWSRVETVFSPMNVTVGILTLGLYTPAKVTISCRDYQSRR